MRAATSSTRGEGVVRHRVGEATERGVAMVGGGVGNGVPAKDEDLGITAAPGNPCLVV